MHSEGERERERERERLREANKKVFFRSSAKKVFPRFHIENSIAALRLQVRSEKSVEK